MPAPRSSCLTDGEFGRHHWVRFPTSDGCIDSAGRCLVKAISRDKKCRRNFHGSEKESGYR